MRKGLTPNLDANELIGENRHRSAPLERLVTGWAGKDRSVSHSVILCAFKKFGENLSHRMMHGSKKDGTRRMTAYFRNNQEESANFVELMNAITGAECGGRFSFKELK
jgi:hypothetical protein